MGLFPSSHEHRSSSLMHSCEDALSTPDTATVEGCQAPDESVAAPGKAHDCPLLLTATKSSSRTGKSLNRGPTGPLSLIWTNLQGAPN